MDDVRPEARFEDDSLDELSEDSAEFRGARARRSDQHRSSRRRQAKRHRRAAREDQKRREQARAERRAASAAARVAAAGLEIDPEAEPSPASLPVEVAALTRAEQRVVAKKGRTRRSMARAGSGMMVLALVVGAAGIGAGLRLLARDGDPAASSSADGPVLADGVDRQPTLLLMTADDTTDVQAADSAVILAYDRIHDTATVLLIPVSTAADVPGHGVLPLSRSLEFGGPALAAAAMDNLLGITLDGVAAMGYRSWATLLGRAGPLTIEVPERIVTSAEDGGAQVQFLAGVQTLDGPRAAEYLAATREGEPELSALPRIQAVLLAWLTALSQDEALLDRVLEDGLPMVDTGMPRAEVLDLVRAMVDAVGRDRLDFRVLPVRPIGSGAEDGYRPDQVRLEELVADRFVGSVPDVSREGRSLHLLNGNGSPGIGQKVAARLLPAGFKVVLTGNADTFDHAVTKIVIYDDSPEQLAIAREIKELLGVGEIELSLTPQSVVDVTIVVGLDFTAS